MKILRCQVVNSIPPALYIYVSDGRNALKTVELTQLGFAVNADETGLQPILMGYSVKETPISWINRTPDMGISSFRLVKVGGGYWQVLFGLWLKTVLRKINPKFSRK